MIVSLTAGVSLSLVFITRDRCQEYPSQNHEPQPLVNLLLYESHRTLHLYSQTSCIFLCSPCIVQRILVVLNHDLTLLLKITFHLLPSGRMTFFSPVGGSIAKEMTWDK